jgi:hypothetical protein
MPDSDQGGSAYFGELGEALMNGVATLRTQQAADTSTGTQISLSHTHNPLSPSG